MFEGKPDRFYTCWKCILGELFNILKGSDEVRCVCSDKDARKILVYKDKDGEWQFEINEPDEVSC